MKAPADVTHGRLAAAGTGLHINAEALKKNTLWGIGRKTCLEGLMSLKAEQDPESLLLDRACQKSEVADLLKAVGKNMHQEPADELIVGESHLLSGIAIFVVAIPEGDGMVRDLQDAGIRDGDTVSVTAKIIDGIAEAVEGLLKVDDPIGAVKIIDETLPVNVMQRIGKGCWKNELAGIPILFQGSHELAAKHLRGCSDRKEEAVSAFTQFPIPAKAGARDDAVDMRME